ncbi:MAG: DUF1894 domain-containing protein [Euryarchaeota archaeon]|nr:DUF1894 domain-containing protein [Euryarchaeota archaeon]
MNKRIDDRDYEILLHDISFTEGASHIEANAEEVYYVEPGYKIFGKRLVGTTPIPVGVSRDHMLLIYITPPYYRGYFLALPRDEGEVAKLRHLKKS